MKFINDVYLKISRIRAGLVFLLYGIILLSSGSNIFAIDYFEITNPKFIPVKVGLAKENNPKEVLLLNVFKENLEKVLYFQLILATKEEFEQSEKIVYYLDLELKSGSKQLRTTLRTQGEKYPVSQETFALVEDQDLRKLGRKLADWFVEYTLEFKGVSSSRIAYTAQKTNRRKNIMKLFKLKKK